MTNIADILDRPASEVERPKPLPVGTYLTVIKGLPRQDKTSQKKTDFVEFTHQIMQAGDDVDEDSLKAYLTKGDGTKKKLTECTIKNTYYLTEDALWRLTKFLDDCGIDLDDKSIGQGISDTPNSQVLITVKHQASQDGTTVFANVADTARAE